MKRFKKFLITMAVLAGVIVLFIGGIILFSDNGTSSYPSNSSTSSEEEKQNTPIHSETIVIGPQVVGPGTTSNGDVKVDGLGFTALNLSEKKSFASYQIEINLVIYNNTKSSKTIQKDSFYVYFKNISEGDGTRNLDSIDGKDEITLNASDSRTVKIKFSIISSYYNSTDSMVIYYLNNKIVTTSKA